MNVHGRPGAHASHLARTAATSTALWASAATVLAVAALQAGARPSLAAVAGGAACAAGWWSRQRSIDWRKASVGARSERRVARTLERSGVDVVAHGLLLGAGGDCDHLVLGPVVAVVETKTGRGPIHVNQGRVAAGARIIPGDPVAQARRQAAAVHRATGTWCAAIVCIPDGTGGPYDAGGVTVCNLDDLVDVLRRLPAVVNATDARRHLWRLTGTTAATPV